MARTGKIVLLFVVSLALLAAIILAPCAFPLNGPSGYCYPLIIKGDKLR